MSVQMLQNIIWTRFFTKPVYWQNSVVIFEKSYLPHMTSFFAKIQSVDRSRSQESNKIEFASLDFWSQIFKSEWPKVNTSRLRDLTLKAAISMLFLILFSCLRFPKRYGCQLFNATRITSFRPLTLTLCTKHQLKVKSANYLQYTSFCIFHPKVPSKHKPKNIKAFYRSHPRERSAASRRSSIDFGVFCFIVNKGVATQYFGHQEP